MNSENGKKKTPLIEARGFLYEYEGLQKIQCVSNKLFFYFPGLSKRNSIFHSNHIYVF